MDGPQTRHGTSLGADWGELGLRGGYGWISGRGGPETGRVAEGA